MSLVRKEIVNFVFIELRVPLTKKKCIVRKIPGAGVRRPRVQPRPVTGSLWDLGWSLLLPAAQFPQRQPPG